MESLSREERLRLVASLNWDYDADPSSMLEVIDGLVLKTGPFDARRLLVLSLERLSWHRIVALWGVERLLAVYDPTVLSRIRSPEFRRRFAFVFGVLRNEVVSPQDGVLRCVEGCGTDFFLTGGTAHSRE